MRRLVLKLVLTVLAILLISANTVACFPKMPDPYIFDDISECKRIEDLSFTNHKVSVATTTQGDKHLNSLSYQEFYNAQYSSDELNFEIFAYVFDTPLAAQEYFNSVSGNNCYMDINFYLICGATKCEYTVLRYEKAYHINGYTAEHELLLETLSQIFSQRLIKTEDSSIEQTRMRQTLGKALCTRRMLSEI